MKKGRNSDMKKRRYTYLAGEDILLFKRRYTPFQKKIYCALAGSWMAGFLLMLLTLTACVGEELQKPLLGEGEGYLTLQIGAISAEVTTSPLTKTPTPLDASLVPAPKDLTINITNTNTQEIVFTGSPTGESMTFSLKTGTYTVEAHYGKDSTLQETPYFHDSKDITIGSLTASEVSLTPSLANAMLVPVVDEDLKKHYSEWTLSVKVGSASQDLAANSMERNLYVQSGRPVEITFNGTNLINEKTSKTAQVTDAAQPRTQYTIQCNPKNLPSFNLTTKAKAAHTYNENNYLTGTEVTLNVTELAGTPTELISRWEATLKNADGNPVRNYSANGAPTQGSNPIMNVEGDWPYLPQGNYTLSTKLYLKTQETVNGANIPVTVSAPEFTVSASAYTSYNKYIEGKSAESKGLTNEANELIAAANGCDGSTIYDMKAVPTISETLLTNSNYSKSTELYIGSEKVTDPTSKVLSWGAHTLTASYTFDGATYSGSGTYHLTGLPYSAVPPKVKGDHAWTYDAKDAWGGTDEYAKIGNGGIGTTTLQSPSFHVPTDILIQLSTKYQAYGDKTGTTFTMYLGDEKLWTTTAKDRENTGAWYNPNYVYDRPIIEDSKASTVTTTNNYIKCTNSYSLVFTHSKVYYVNIYYR